jgi:hypothetical protein
MLGVSLVEWYGCSRNCRWRRVEVDVGPSCQEISTSECLANQETSNSLLQPRR